MTADVLKRDVSLTVLKVRVAEGEALLPHGGPAQQTNRSSKRRIHLELQVTGNAEERGFVPPTVMPSQNRAPSRRGEGSNIGPSYTSLDSTQQAALSRTLARWTFAPEEMQLPLHFAEAANFREKAGAIREFVANAARAAVAACFTQIRADELERIATFTNWLPSGNPTLPSPMLRQLRTLLPTVLREGDSLWLEISEPTGYLPLLPWEEMLRAATAVPVLRLSPHPVQAASLERALSVVVCLSAPSKRWTPTKATLAPFLSAIRASLPERSLVHVFADDLCHPPVAEAVKTLAEDDANRTIKVHSSPTDLREEFDAPVERPAVARLEPDAFWTRWIARGLAGHAADLFHFVAPGLVFANQARLMVARTPVPLIGDARLDSRLRGRPTRYLTALELAQAVTRLGSWGVVFSEPPLGATPVHSRMALRLIVDEVGRLRPGVAAFHDVAGDIDGKVLRETYAFLAGTSKKPPNNPAVALYCHPARTTPSPAMTAFLPPDLQQQYEQLKNVIQATTAQNQRLPVWLAATQRIVEQAVSRAASGESRVADPDAMRGLTMALGYVEKMVAKQPQAGNPTPTTISQSTAGNRGETSA